MGLQHRLRPFYGRDCVSVALFFFNVLYSVEIILLRKWRTKCAMGDMCLFLVVYSKTCLKRPLKIDKTKV